MRIILCGGRNYNDPAAIAQALAHFARTGPHTLVHGACKTFHEDGSPYRLGPRESPGADRLAHFIALALGWQVEPHVAKWSLHHKAAGPRRNQHMADLGADGLVAFPGGSGTVNMIECARQAGIPDWKPPWAWT